MDRKKTYVPGKDLRVVDPLTRLPLPPEGTEVTVTDTTALYWAKRLEDKDVVEGTASKKSTPKEG